MQSMLFAEPLVTRANVQPRDYQIADHDECFRLWDSGTVGTLTRIFTGGGKTILSAMKADTWLARGDDYHVMVISYEEQLVWQFAEEISEFLGIQPGIEMGENSLSAVAIPRIVVASRQSLLRATPPDDKQKTELAKYGIMDTGPAPKRACKKYLKYLSKGGDKDDVTADILRLSESPEADGNYWSRLHKFDWRLNWLVVFDEAHKHAYMLTSVGHIVDWFERNARSRRNGATATPLRTDKVSLGHKMFPGIASDYPLFHATKPCAVKDGWAVPYVQKYIAVEGVDFKQVWKIKEEFKQSQELERILGEESVLATLVQPLLDMVGDRRAIIFSPGVEMSKNVARFINARCEAVCPSCNESKWYPYRLIGDGAQCKCGTFIESHHVTKSGEQAKALDGEISHRDRKPIYAAHQRGEFQFLSIVGLCREGYNDPDISCVAIFRPVSKAASSLAEQMKGRGCRPKRGILNGLTSAEQRLEAIANSDKPNCLIVDLVGITGLQDCASTVQIYADGLEDEVVKQAEKNVEEKAKNGQEADVQEEIENAKREVENTRERIRLEREAAEKRAREEAERRAKADAEVKYTTHDVGVGSNVDPKAATESQLKFLERLGMGVAIPITKKQARRMITMLLKREGYEKVAYENGLGESDWDRVEATHNQKFKLNRLGIQSDKVRCIYDASLLIESKLQPQKLFDYKLGCFSSADADKLAGIGHDLRLIQGTMPAGMMHELIEAGKRRKEFLNGGF